MITSRDEILARTRDALKRGRNAPVPPPPTALLAQSPKTPDQLLDQFKSALEALGGNVVIVRSPAEACAAVQKILDGRTAAASPAPILATCGITATNFSREACATVDAGITSADFALADTGSLVLLTESHESRLLSLLPPCHIAVIEQSKIVASLDDVFRSRPLPGDDSSAMVVITGPSRTGDIEMRLVRGVHGPGEIHAVIIAPVSS